MAIPEDKVYTEAYLRRSGWKRNGVWWTNPTLEPGETNYAGAVRAQKRDDARLSGGAIGQSVLERRQGVQDALPAPIPVTDAVDDAKLRAMSDAALRAFIEKLRQKQSVLNDKFVAAGRGYERASETRAKTDALARESNDLADELRAAVVHQEFRRTHGAKFARGKVTDRVRLHRALDAMMDRAEARDAQFSMTPAKAEAVRKAWVAASETADKLADEWKATEKLAEHWQEVWRNAKTPDEKAKAGAQCDLAGRAAGRARRMLVDANIAEEKAKQALTAGLRKRM